MRLDDKHRDEDNTTTAYQIVATDLGEGFERKGAVFTTFDEAAEVMVTALKNNIAAGVSIAFRIDTITWREY